MRVDRKPSGLAASFPKGLAIGTLAAMASTLALSALLAGLIVSGTVREGSLGYGVMALVFLGAAVCYLVTLTALTALFFGGQLDGFFPTAMLIIGGSGTAFLLSARAGKGRKGPKKYR